MTLTYDKFTSITWEEACVFPPESLYRSDYRLEISRDGFVSEDSRNGDSRYYKASPEDVRELYDRIDAFTEEITDVDVTIDDTSRIVTIGYCIMNLELPALAFNKEKVYLKDIIDEFVDTKCVETEGEEETE